MFLSSLSSLVERSYSILMPFSSQNQNRDCKNKGSKKKVLNMDSPKDGGQVHIPLNEDCRTEDRLIWI